MAAPTVRAVGTETTQSAAGSLDVPVPAGTVTNDLLVCSVRAEASAPGNINPADGTWNTLFNAATSGTGLDINTYIFWRIAGGSEPANYTFNYTGGSDTGIGRMTAIASVNTANPINTSSNAANSTAGTTATGATFTPTVADTLIMMFVVTNNGGTVSAYALPTDSPTFTERYDTAPINSAGALATGPRTATTASGAPTATLSVSSRYAVQMLAIAPVAITAIPELRLAFI